MPLAVAGLIAITTLFVTVVIYHLQYSSDTHLRAFEQNISLPEAASQILTLPLLGGISLTIIAIVGLASLFKWLQLRGGGRVVAESMGGRLITFDNNNADEKRVLNVVEEMAIASGTPVPPVYLLDEPSINAFAAAINRKMP